MRSFYLRRNSESGNAGGSRGGVGSNNDFGDYELEIGSSQHASAEMIVFCSMIDEILEHLKNNPSNIGHLLLTTYKQKVKELSESMQQQ